MPPKHIETDLFLLFEFLTPRRNSTKLGLDSILIETELRDVRTFSSGREKRFILLTKLLVLLLRSRVRILEQTVKTRDSKLHNAFKMTNIPLCAHLELSQLSCLLFGELELLQLDDSFILNA
jgi:hypothetical protein